MSLDAIKWAMSQAVGKASTKFVLVAMADCVNTEGCAMVCWPSHAYLARVTHHDIKTVEVAVCRLKECGFIVDTGMRRGETGKVIVYRLNTTKTGGIEPGPQETQTIPAVVPNTPESGGVGSVPNTPVFPANTPENGDQYPRNPLPIPPKTGVRSRKKQEGTRKEAGSAITSIPDVPPEVFSDWMTARKRKPVTPTALNAIEREATKAGLTLAEAVTACAEFGWQGFNSGWYANRTQQPSTQKKANGNKHAAAARAIWGDPNQPDYIDAETH